MTRKRKPHNQGLSLYKFRLICVALVALAAWIGGNMHAHKIDMSKIPNPQTVEISQAELQAFIPVWTEYLEREKSKPNNYIPSMSATQPEESLDKETQEWLLRRQWRPKRFFYVEQRLLTIIKTLELNQQTAQNIANLQNQRASLQQQKAQGVESTKQMLSLESGLENMIRAQQLRVNIEHITPEELQLVAPVRPMIQEIYSRQ